MQNENNVRVHRRTSSARRLIAASVFPALAVAQFAAAAPASTARSAVDVGPGDVVVHTALGGFILGYDIDASGTHGLLSEAASGQGGGHDVAVETFDVQTGAITGTVIRRRNSKSDFVTLGIVGGNTGLVEFEHVSQVFVDKRVYLKIQPIASGRFTGRWTPPLGTNDLIDTVSGSPGTALTAFMYFGNGGFNISMFTSDVAANTFGPTIAVNDPRFAVNNAPAMAFDGINNRAVIGASNGCPLCLPTMGIVDLATGQIDTFAGSGLGYVNGIAIDPEAGIACTTTEIDFSVEFYDLATHIAKHVRLPRAVSQAQSGSAVQFDPVNKLFLVGQPISSTAPTGSSIHVYDEFGSLVESLNGFTLPFSPAAMPLVPSQRLGFVIVTPDLSSLQSFTY